MRSRIVFVLLLVAGLATQATAQTPPLFGTWKLNIARSVYDPGPTPYKKSTCRIEPWEDGLKVIYDMIGVRGGITHLEWTGKLDGRDYPIQGVDDVLTNAYTRIDDRTYDIILKHDGVRVATARVSISADGRTLTTVTTSRSSQGRNLVSTTIYERP